MTATLFLSQLGPHARDFMQHQLINQLRQQAEMMDNNLSSSSTCDP